MNKKDVFLVLGILIFTIVLIFFGYQDYLRQKNLIQPGEPESAMYANPSTN